MKRRNKAGLYVGASLFTAGLIFLFFFVLPYRSALNLVDTTAKQFDVFADDIQEGQASLNSQPGPNSIKTGSVGSASAYSQSLNRSLTALNIEPLEVPEPISNRWNDDKIDGFNNIVGQEQFKTDVEFANGAAARAYGFIYYHDDVMKSLGNVLEYNPTDDLSLTDTEGLLLTIRAAGGGIERTVQELNAQTYTNDPGLDDVLASLAKLEASRAAYELAIEAGDLKGDEYSAFVNMVAQVQADIIANRQQFWDANYPVVDKELNQVITVISPYRSQLGNI